MDKSETILVCAQASSVLQKPFQYMRREALHYYGSHSTIRQVKSQPRQTGYAGCISFFLVSNACFKLLENYLSFVCDHQVQPQRGTGSNLPSFSDRPYSLDQLLIQQFQDNSVDGISALTPWPPNESQSASASCWRCPFLQADLWSSTTSIQT